MSNFLKEKTISISILNVDDLENFLFKLNEIRKEFSLNNLIIHFDVMDGDFVANHGINIELIKVVKKYNFFVDVHLMCFNPKDYIDKALELGADNITIHYEIDNLYDNLKYLNTVKDSLKKEKKKLSIGISIKPDTDIKKIFNYSSMCDVILLMSVKPGMGGQTYINKVNKKIEIALDMKKLVQIDGGINDSTIIRPNKLGVNSFVVGSYLTSNTDDISKRIIELENIINNKRGD